MSASTPEEIIARALRQADLAVSLSDVNGRLAARQLMISLSRAERDLERRLDIWVGAHGGDEMRFTEASLRAYLEQTRATIAYVQATVEGLTAMEAERVAFGTLNRQGRLIRDLERAFTGVVVPTRSREAVMTRVRPSLIARRATSADRYGAAMTRKIMGTMSQGFVEGVSQRDMVNRLVRLKGPQGVVSIRAVAVQPGMVVRLSTEDIPEGLFVRHRSWAWRVVRTEVADAQNAVSLESMTADREDDMPDMRKKIMAVLDLRTAQDSLGVHGQIRETDEMFRDGAGREYLRPPSRPYDRETIMPWRPHWDETMSSRPLTEERQAEVWKENQRWQAERATRRARMNRNRTD